MVSVPALPQRPAAVFSSDAFAGVVPALPSKMPGRYRVSRADFAKMRGFRRLSGALFTLSFGEVLGRRTPGAAVVVSKKVAAKAVARNTIKRRARAVLTGELKGNDSPTVFVLIAKKEAHKALFSAVQADIRALVAKARASR